MEAKHSITLRRVPSGLSPLLLIIAVVARQMSARENLLLLLLEPLSLLDGRCRRAWRSGRHDGLWWHTGPLRTVGTANELVHLVVAIPWRVQVVHQGRHQ